MVRRHRIRTLCSGRSATCSSCRCRESSDSLRRSSAHRCAGTSDSGVSKPFSESPEVASFEAIKKPR